MNTATEKNPDESLIYYITINLISCNLFIIVKIFTSFEKGQGESNLKKNTKMMQFSYPDEFLIYYITINLISCILFIIVKIFTSFKEGQGESNLKKTRR